jgi:hypothetical protein
MLTSYIVGAAEHNNRELEYSQSWVLTLAPQTTRIKDGIRRGVFTDMPNYSAAAW